MKALVSCPHKDSVDKLNRKPDSTDLIEYFIDIMMTHEHDLIRFINI